MRNTSSFLVLLVISAAMARGGGAQACPLTDAQQSAVEAAIKKLEEVADGSLPNQEPWPDDDPRWDSLGDLIEGTTPVTPCEWCSPEPFPRIEISSESLGANGPYAVTVPEDGAMSEHEFNDIYLNKDLWRGPDGDQFGADDARAACWILSCVLLHEGSHQDDCYPWPPGQCR